MVNVLSKSCLHESCTKKPSFNIAGSKAAVYCMQHALDGMMNIRSKRCSSDSCMKHPCYNVEGSKTPVYCKRHALDGMVNVVNKRCSRDSCTKRPNYNVEGSKKGAYCKQHADDGMVDVIGRRCSQGDCTKYPSFNTEGSKTPAYCKQHALDSMIMVNRRTCSRDLCSTAPSSNVQGKTPAYCKQHADEGMVNVRKKRFCNKGSKPGPEPCVPPIVGAIQSIQTKISSSDGKKVRDESTCDVVSCRNLSSVEIDGKHPPNGLDRLPYKQTVFPLVAMVSIKGSPRELSCVAPVRYLDSDTVGRAAEQSHLAMLRTETLLPNKGQSMEPIKTEMELAIMF